MHRIAAIAWKDLRSTARNLPALVMMLLAPLALAALLGFAFGGGGDFSISATKVVVANGDQEAPGGGAGDSAGTLIVDVLTSPDLATILSTAEVSSAAEARRRVDAGTDVVAVLIPPDLSAALFAAGGGRKTTIELYENPTQGIGGDITESIVGQTLLSFDGARAAATAAATLAAAGDQAQRGPQLAAAAAARYLKDGGAGARVAVVQRPPVLPEGQTSRDVGVTGVILAGMMVFFMFFGASNVARTILDEEQAGTLPRLFTTPASRTIILGGKFTSVFVTVTAQAVVLLAAGALIFRIDWGSPGAVAALTLLAAAVASGLALLIISMVRTTSQAGAIGAGVYLVLGLLGGNFTGTSATLGTYASIQLVTPNGWLLRGWDTVMRGGTILDVGLNLAVTAAFAVVFFVLAAWRFRKRYA